MAYTTCGRIKLLNNCLKSLASLHWNIFLTTPITELALFIWAYRSYSNDIVYHQRVLLDRKKERKLLLHRIKASWIVHH